MYETVGFGRKRVTFLADEPGYQDFLAVRGPLLTSPLRVQDDGRGWRAPEPEGLGREAAVSAGGSYRRGYYIVAQRPVDHTSAPEAGLQGFFVAILATMLVLLVVVLATDPSLSAGIAPAIRGAWSDIVAALSHH